MDRKLKKIMKLAEQNDWEKLHLKLLDYTQSNSLDSEGFYHLGMSFLKQNKWKESEENLKKSIELDSKMTTAFIGLGVLYARKKDRQRAEFNFSKALERDDSNLSARMNLASICVGKGEYERALKLYEKIPFRKMDLGTAYGFLLSTINAGSVGDAESLLEKIESHPQASEIRKELADAKWKLEEKKIETQGVWSFLKNDTDPENN